MSWVRSLLASATVLPSKSSARHSASRHRFISSCQWAGVAVLPVCPAIASRLLAWPCAGEMALGLRGTAGQSSSDFGRDRTTGWLARPLAFQRLRLLANSAPSSNSSLMVAWKLSLASVCSRPGCHLATSPGSGHSERMLVEQAPPGSLAARPLPPQPQSRSIGPQPLLRSEPEDLALPGVGLPQAARTRWAPRQTTSADSQLEADAACV